MSAPRIDAGSISARWLTNGQLTAAQLNVGADILPVFKVNGAEEQLTPVEMYDAMARHPLPHNTTPPVISGTPTVGFTLVSTPGTWTNHPTLITYQWRRNGAPIAAATASTYPLVLADLAATITCAVTATNARGSAGALTNALGPVAAAAPSAPVNTVAPVASGTATVGQTLSVSNGTWTGSPTYTRQWRRNGTPIGGATASTYVLVLADAGALVSCLITGTNVSGSASAASNSLGPVALAGSKLAPSAQWGAASGAAGSGFGGSNPAAPVDPGEGLGQPWCRALFLNWDVVTSDYVVGFDAGAYNGDPGDTDLDHMVFWLEGNSLTVTVPSQHDYTDVNVTAQQTFGYQCVLDYAAWLALAPNGVAQLYVTAVPKNPALNSRVMGPYTLYARTSRFTVKKTVGVSGDYPTLKAALTYAASVSGTQRVNLELIDSTTYPWDTLDTDFSNAQWWTVITAKAGVSATLGDGTKALTQPGYAGIQLEGSGINFDIAKLGYNLASAYRFSNGGNSRLALVGVNGPYCGTMDPAHGGSGSGAAALIFGNQTNQFWVGGNDPFPSWNLYFIDCVAHDLPGYGLSFCALRLNSTLAGCSGSDNEFAQCVHGGWSSQVGGYYTGLRTEQGAFDLTGPVGSAYEKIGANGHNGAFAVYDVAANASPTHSIAIGDTTTVGAVVAAINTWSGYVATPTASTNALAAQYISRADVPIHEAVPKTALVGTAHLTRIADIHADQIVWYDSGSPITIENRAIRFFENRESVGTSFISVPSSIATLKSVGLRNLSNQDLSVSLGEPSQPGIMAGPHKHMVIQFLSSTNPSAYAMSGTYDTYCAFDHSAAALAWNGAPQTNFHLTSLAAPSLPLGADANSKTVSATATLNYTAPNATPTPNFTPLSPLTLTDASYAGRLRPNGTEQGT